MCVSFRSHSDSPTGAGGLGAAGDEFRGNRHRGADGRSEFGFSLVSGILAPDRAMWNPPIRNWEGGRLGRSESAPKNGISNKGVSRRYYRSYLARAGSLGEAIREPPTFRARPISRRKWIRRRDCLRRNQARVFCRVGGSGIRRLKEIARECAPMKAELDRVTPKHLRGRRRVLDPSPSSAWRRNSDRADCDRRGNRLRVRRRWYLVSVRIAYAQ